MKLRIAAQALALVGALAAPSTPVFAQQPADAPVETPARQTPASWPELDKAAKKRVDKLAQTLRRTKKEERRDEAEAELITIGAGTAPLLLAKLSDHKSAVALNASLCRVLTDVTTAEHTPLLTPHAKSKKRAVRHWVAERLTAFARADLAPIFRDMVEDQDPEIAFQARLGLLSTGDISELDAILARARDDWETVAPRLPAALTPARSTEAMQHVLATIREADERTQVTGLRLLRWLAPKNCGRFIAPFLDAEQHAVKKAAINALRVAVDGDAPLEKLAVFTAIEQAQQWKARVQ